MKPITLSQYFGVFDRTPEVLDEHRANAETLIARVNALLTLAERGGVTLETNQKTGSMISGSGNGGWRLRTATFGAENSSHKEGQGIDIYDPNDGDLDAWCLTHLTDLIVLGLYMEHPSMTKGWCHLTTRAPRSKHRVFYP